MKKQKAALGFTPDVRSFASLVRRGLAALFFREGLPSDPTGAVTAVVYKGSIILVGLFIVIFGLSVFAEGNYYALPRAYGLVPLITYMVITAIFYHRKQFRVVAWLLVILYALIAVTTLALWSINAPIGLLLAGFVIILAGVCLGARYIVPATLSIVVILLVLQILQASHMLSPDLKILSYTPNASDVATYGTVFMVFAIVSWLSGRKMEQALERALQAEDDLADERNNLAERLEQKTREVRAAQMEEMRQLYRFAELGQISTVLMHDLANNLTALTLDIDDIDTQRTNESVASAKESIRYLETVIGSVRRQLRESDATVAFDPLLTILETLGTLGPKAHRAGVIIEYERLTKRPFLINGDPIRFAHILTILVTNGIEAYGNPQERSYTPSVIISARLKARHLTISVTDYGKGISMAQRGRLFKPFTSTKQNGMGIGLFMAREMVQRHFNGTLELDSQRDKTMFVLDIPRAKKPA